MDPDFKTKEGDTRPESVTPGERDDAFYRFLAGTPMTKIFESASDLGLPFLLATRGPLTAAEIAQALGLHPKRARKWLVLLERVGLVTRHEDRYSNSTMSGLLFWDAAGVKSFFVQDMIEYCRRCNNLDFAAVLRGMPLPEAVRWPPRTRETAQQLEYWMTLTAHDTLTALETAVDWTVPRSLLDVGGGDATIACALVRKYPGLRVTVFNLPASAEMARARIAREDTTGRVTVTEGDFLKDELPKGFDRVLFSRVLADWDIDVARDMIGRARTSLVPGGRLHICEPFIDRNPDLALSWQFRYIFYDDFGVETYKFIQQYQALIADAGFAESTVQDRVADTLYGVITAVTSGADGKREEK